VDETPDVEVEDTDTKKKKVKRGPFVSHTGITLERAVTFQFALDPNQAQSISFAKSAGARRMCYNYHIGVVKENLHQRDLVREEFGEAITPSLSWTDFSLINDFNSYKAGKSNSSPQNEDGTKGLAWRGEIPQDVFECASVDAADAMKNWHTSKMGVRKGPKMNFPDFRAKNRDIPRFRLRNKSKAEQPPKDQPIKFTDASHVSFPKIGPVKVHGPTREVRRMLEAGRFHIYSASFSMKGGRWYVSLTGVAAPRHHLVRSPKSKHPRSVGVDLGLTYLAVVADDTGEHLISFEGVNQLRSAEQRLITAQQALSRTKMGSKGRAKAKRKLNKLHHLVANARRHLLHQVSSYLVRNCSRVVIEDLNVKQMLQNHQLVKSITDAAWGELRRQIEYKAAWYGVEVVLADRYFPSSKTCSGCGHVKESLSLSTRTYHCEHCDLVIDRDLNAAINLARYVAHISAASTT
jgi:putative transposase